MRLRALAFIAAVCLTGVASTAIAQEGGRFTVTVTGQGPDIVLVPGLASSAATWDATALRLASSHRVHAVQVAGFAGLPAGPNATGALLEPLVRDLARYVQTLNAPALIGHSLGGLIVLEIASTHPAAISRVMVVDALPFYPLLFDPRATVERAMPQATAMRAQLLAQTDDVYRQTQAAGVRNLVKDEAARTRVREWVLTSDRATVATAIYDDMTTDARPALAGIHVPTTVLYAHHADMRVPPAALDAMYASAYALLPGAVLTRIDDSYHFIMFDQPDAFAKAVDQFLRR